MKSLLKSDLFSVGGFGLAVLIILAASVAVGIRVQIGMETQRKVAQSLAVIAKIDELQAHIIDAETGERGFLLTRDETFLKPYYEALNLEHGIDFQVDELKALISDNPNQIEKMSSLEDLILKELDYLSETIRLKKFGLIAAENIGLIASGNSTMDEIRGVLAEMRQEESNLLETRRKSAGNNLQYSVITIAAGVLIGFSLLSFSFWAGYREVRQRRQADAVIQRLNEELEGRIEKRTVELTQANIDLKESGSRLQNVLDTMIEGCQIIDPEFRYLYMNDAAVQHSKKTREDLIGKTMMESYPGIEESEVFKKIQDSMVARTRHRTLIEFEFPDHSKGWFELFIQPVAEGVFILSEDITERHMAEEAIQAQLGRLQALREIDLAIMGSTDVMLTLRVVFDQIRSHLKIDAIDVMFMNPVTHILNYANSVGFKNIGLVEQAEFRLGLGIAGDAALNNEIRHVKNLEDVREQIIRTSLIDVERFVEYYAIPLYTKGSLLGIMEIFHRSPLNLDSNALDFLKILAGHTAVAIDSSHMFAGLQRANLDLLQSYDFTIEGWSKALDLRDKETEGHTQRVTELTLNLARRIGIKEDDLIHIRRGALLHDIGKMGVPDNILLKPGPLTDEEWVVMRQHPKFAFELLYPIEYLRPALDIPYCHHEKWDGTGYPRGLGGTSIPQAARLFSIIDYWDAVTSDRPYRSAWTHEKALATILSLKGTHFDPDIVDMFLDMMKNPT